MSSGPDINERRPEHILFVDDELLVAEVTGQILEDQGYRVTVRRDGQEALEFYQQAWKDVDLVILDMMMPRMGGKDAFLAMRKVNPDLRAFIVSGFSVQGEAQLLLQSGALGFLQKPYRRADLLAMVAKALGR
jgi:CheY-like chemotaxis protein